MTNKESCHAGLRSGIHSQGVTYWKWIPAYAGMTKWIMGPLALRERARVRVGFPAGLLALSIQSQQ